MVESPENTKPNILLIMSDEHSAEFSSVYGNAIVQTPTLDRLSREGVTFERAYCNSPLCVPARMSFMTGKYVHREEIWDNGVPLRSDAITWAHRLANGGYKTALSGKMHFIGPDQHHGFDEVLASDETVCAKKVEVDFRWVDEVSPRPNSRARFDAAGPGGGAHIDHDRAVTKTCLEYLDRQASVSRSAAGAQPFLLCAGYNSPHFPLIAPEDYYSIYHPDTVDMPVAWDQPIADLGPHQQRLRTLFGLQGLTEDQVRRARAAYFGLISWMDHEAGLLIDKLEETGLIDNTIVIYTADHGDMAGTHGLWWKSSFYEQAVHIPLVIRTPGDVHAGARRSELISHLDLSATILDLAGVSAQVDVSEGMDGQSLRPLLDAGQDGHVTWRDHAISDYYAQASRNPMRMIRQGNYKLNIYHGETLELFDLAADPYEMDNLADDQGYRAVRREMQKLAYQDWEPEVIDQKVRRSQNERWVINNGNRREYLH